MPGEYSKETQFENNFNIIVPVEQIIPDIKPEASGVAPYPKPEISAQNSEPYATMLLQNLKT